MMIRSKLNPGFKGLLAVAAALSLLFALGKPAQTATLGTSFPLLVADNLSNSILKVDAAGGRTVLTTGGNLYLYAYQPVGLAVDKSGALYVSSVGNHTIVKVDSAGAQSIFTSGGYLSTPDALAFDANGNLYVASMSNASIVKVDSTGQQTLFTSGNLLDAPSGLAFDANGDLYVANWNNSNIVKVDSAGGQSLFTSGGNLSSPTALVFDNAGNLLVASVSTHSIVKVDPQGTQSVFASSPYLSSHFGMAFDGSGNLYVTSIPDKAIIKIDSAGNQSFFTPFLGTGMAGPGGLAFSLPPNTAPKIKAGADVTRQQGSPAGSAVTIASVNDAETPKGALVVTAASVPSGITLGPITNNKGIISATVAADTTAALGDNSILLSVSDGRASATAFFTVHVTGNTPPVLGKYPGSVTLTLGSGTTITPQAPPTDNGTVTSLTAVAPGFTGTLSANLTTGAITIANAGPEGKYTILVTATDNSGALTSALITLTVKR